MHKVLWAALAATILVPVGASAQSAREVRGSAREVREDRRDVRQAQRQGDYRDVREERRDLRDSRRELREDWRDYRSSHRDVFRRGAYTGPRGYRYRPVSIGYQFAPAYYGRNYWVNDFQRYRLPSPAAGQRWIRYGNDVVLINSGNGRVVRVYNDFFL